MDVATVTAILSGMPMPVVLIGADERIAGVNRAAIRLFGGDRSGRHYVTALRQPAILDAVERGFAGGETARAAYLAIDGERDSTFSVSVSPIAIDGTRALLLTFEDVTATEAAVRMRRDFVANVSHELRTPLTAVLGFIETLRGAARDDPAARERFLGIVEREARRMAQLVDDLLSLGRVEQDERVRPRDAVDLGALIEDVVAALAPVAADAGAVIEVARPGGIVFVPGNANQLRQVLTNLIENAIKYGGRSAPVTVTLTDAAPEPALRADGMRIAVTDRGEGIAAHHIPRLTERFYRIDTHRSRELGGTGLGLAIVKHIVSRHRGRLRIDSVPGQGSTFTVILPAA